MKKTIRILIPIFLAAAILLCTAWYLFVYDRDFTRDVLVSCARYCEQQGDHNTAAWFYNAAYAQSGNNDAVAIELARQYKASGNYTKAEYTLSNAIIDGGGLDLYIELCKTYVEQDKLLDAQQFLNGITNEQVKSQLDQMRPKTPAVSHEPGTYNQYISIAVEAEQGTLYVTTDGSYPSTSQSPYTQPLELVNGENIIRAVSVADNGLISQLAVYSYTIVGIVEPVQFSDAAIEAELRSLLGIPGDTIVYTDDLWNIAEFTVPVNAQSYDDLAYLIRLKKLTVNQGIASEMDILSELRSLESLTVTETALSQDAISYISAMTALTELTLDSCGITNISDFNMLSDLAVLDLSNNTVRNIEAISAMTKLQVLDLSHNALEELSALKDLTTLKFLDVSHNSLTSLADISNLTGLTQLNAGNNSITDLGQIELLSSLTKLTLEFNFLTDVSPLSGCTGLSELDISDNSLTSISVLNTLTELTYLDFSHNQVTELPQFPTDCALVTIDGSHNKLSSLDALAGLEHLNIVKMNYNEKIKSVEKLAECPMLIEVNIYGTSVSDVSALTYQSIVVKYDPTQ